MNASALLKTLRQEARNARRRLGRPAVELPSETERNILASIRSRGYAVVPDFYSAEQCAALRADIDALMKTHVGHVSVDAKGSDHRLFGADRVSPLVKKFYDDPFITRMLHAHARTADNAGLTLAARLDFVQGNAGSGDGWHRDQAVNEQFKSIIYLSDVGPDNGPFEYIEKSHRPRTIIADIAREGFAFNQNRFTNGEIEKLLARGSRKNMLRSFSAPAGTLILVNTRGIHRGKPIEEGVRYALTNYYWSGVPIPEHIRKLAITSKQ